MGDGPANYPYVELEFAKDGSLVHPEQVDAVRDLAGKVSDLVVISHGWNNDMEEATTLYRDLFASVDAVRAAGLDIGARTIGVVGVLWPSKRFSDAELIPGGAAGAESDPTLPADLRASADAFERQDAATILNQAAELTGQLEDSEDAQREYVKLLRSLIKPDDAERADAAEELFALDGPDLLDRLHAAARPGAGAQHGGHDLDDDTGGAASVGSATFQAPDDESGEAAGIGSGLKNLWSKGRGLLNYITYYEMKARAGRIGAGSLAPVLEDALDGKQTTLHLVGHSFGARLVTAAADAMHGAGRVASVSLLQGAFSHNSFAADFEGNPGGYRRLVDERRVAGPFIITHTRNDKAVGIAYAIASSVAGQVSSDVGDKNSRYGGLGSNGAQHTDVVPVTMTGTGDAYQFEPGKIHNLLADACISGHGDVRNMAVANAVLRNILATPS